MRTLKKAEMQNLDSEDESVNENLENVDFKNAGMDENAENLQNSGVDENAKNLQNLQSAYKNLTTITQEHTEDVEDSEMASEDTSINNISDETIENTEGLEIDNNPYFGTEIQGSDEDKNWHHSSGWTVRTQQS